MRRRFFEPTASIDHPEFKKFIQDLAENRIKSLSFSYGALRVDNTFCREAMSALKTWEGYRLFIDALKNNTSLEKIVIDARCDMDQIPAHIINRISSLKSIEFSRYSKGHEEYMAKILQHSSASSITISNFGNISGGPGLNLELLAQALKTSTVKELVLTRGMGVGSVEKNDVDALINVLKQSGSLKVFNATGVISLLNAKRLHEGLKTNLTLKLETGYEDNALHFGQLETQDAKMSDEKSVAEVASALQELTALCMNAKSKIETPAELCKEKLTIEEIKADKALSDKLIEYLVTVSQTEEMVQVDRFFKKAHETLVEDKKGLSSIGNAEEVSQLRDVFWKYEFQARENTAGNYLGFQFDETTKLKFIDFSPSQKYKLGIKHDGLLILTDKKEGKKYFLVRDFRLIEKQINILKNKVPHQQMEITLPKSVRLRGYEPKEESFWRGNWEANIAAYLHYNFVNDPMMLQAIEENLSRLNVKDTITVMDIAGGIGRLGEKVVEKLILTGFKVQYVMTDGCEEECKKAEERFAALQKTYPDKCHYRIIPGKFDEISESLLKDYTGKANILISSGGIIQLDVGMRKAKDSKEVTQADKHLDMFKQFLAPNAIMSITGLTKCLFNKKELVLKTGCVSLRSLFKFKGANSSVDMNPCYVLWNADRGLGK